MVDIICKGITHRCNDLIDSSVAGFNDRITSIIDQIEVITEPTAQGIGTDTTVQRILSKVSGNRVVKRVTVTGQIRGSCQDKVFDMIDQGISN